MDNPFFRYLREKRTSGTLPCTLTRVRESFSIPGNNLIEGVPSIMRNSMIVFRGSRNILVFEEGVNLEDSEIVFNGDDSIVFLCNSRYPYKLDATVNYNCVLYMGRDNYMNGVMHVSLSEQKHFFVGNEGRFSFGIWVRTADPHLIYDSESMKRINPSQSVYIGDHVWIGQEVTLLKGTQIDSGSIIGAAAVLSGKRVPHNTIFAGNPAREIRHGIFWEGSCVHAWKEEKSATSQSFRDYAGSCDHVQSEDDYIFYYNSAHRIAYDELDAVFSAKETEGKLHFLHGLSNETSKARFVHTEF